MALNFPNTPSLGDTYEASGVTYVWDGVKWTSKGSTSGIPILPDEDGNVVITGTLTVNGATITANSADLSGNLNVAGDIDND
jgi:hypothetical protein